MQEALLNTASFGAGKVLDLDIDSATVTEAIKTRSPKEVFFCPEESQFYSQCLEKMVLNRCTQSDAVIEFGTGDGSPVISGLLKTQFKGRIHGYELSAAACGVARSRIRQYHLHDQYTIHNKCFFQGSQLTPANYLIANPPYIPAPDDQICMPTLHGGVDGASITKRLLTVGCENALLMISAYSNPVDTIEHAIAQGYQTVDFMVTPLQFGYYSSEPKVRNWIAELRQQRKAFYSSNIYFLAGVLFQKKRSSQPDLSQELLRVMTAL